MATIRPYRAYWDAKAIEWVYFDAVIGSTVEHNGTALVIGTDDTNPAAATYYSAIKFDTITAPAWVADGPVAYASHALLTVIAQMAERTAGISLIQVAQITSAWTSASTAANMRAVTLSAWGTVSNVVNRYGVPEAWKFSSTDVIHGFMFRVQPAQTVRGGVIRFNPYPDMVLRHFYQYSADLDTRVDATTRVTFDAETLAILKNEAQYNKFKLSATVKVSDRLPNESDIEIAMLKGASVPVINRKMQWPNSADVDIPSAGALPVSLVSNPDLDTTKGMGVETSLVLIKRDGTEVVVGKSGQYVGDVTYLNNGEGEIELRSLLATAYNSRIVDYSPYTTATVNYIAEQAIYIMTDILLNSAGLKYEQLHYNNLPYLMRRFVGVWSPLSYTQTDPAPASWLGLRNKTVGELIAEIGVLYNLAVSQTATGCVSLWHPAVYRESMRVWTIDEKDCLPGGYKLTKRGMEKQYGSIKVSDAGFTGNPVQTTTGQMPNYLPSDPDFNERIKSVSAYGQCFVDHGSARAGMVRQLSQRYTGRYWEAELSMGMQGLAIDNGDVIKLTGTGLSAMARFLVIAVNGNPTAGQVQITCVHYPDVLSVSNTFEDDGVEGEWRWMDETGALDDANTSPNGSDADPTTCTFATVTNEHWQGAIHGAGYAEWAVPLILATAHDVIDICTMVEVDSGGASINYSGWGDSSYLPIMVWRKASGNEALAVGWHRPNYGGSGVHCVTNRMFVAHINDYTAGSFTFAVAVAYTAEGICGRLGGTTAIPASIALQWDDSQNVNLYIDRALVATGAGYSKANWSTVRILTQSDIRIGCVRHLQTDTEITEQIIKKVSYYWHKEVTKWLKY